MKEPEDLGPLDRDELVCWHLTRATEHMYALQDASARQRVLDMASFAGAMIESCISAAALLGSEETADIDALQVAIAPAPVAPNPADQELEHPAKDEAGPMGGLDLTH